MTTFRRVGSQCLRRTSADVVAGKDYTITKRGKPIARIVPSSGGIASQPIADSMSFVSCSMSPLSYL